MKANKWFELMRKFGINFLLIGEIDWDSTYFLFSYSLGSLNPKKNNFCLLAQPHYKPIKSLVILACVCVDCEILRNEKQNQYVWFQCVVWELHLLVLCDWVIHFVRTKEHWWFFAFFVFQTSLLMNGHLNLLCEHHIMFELGWSRICFDTMLDDELTIYCSPCLCVFIVD